MSAEAGDEETRNVTATSAAPKAAATLDLRVRIESLSPSGRTTGRDPTGNLVMLSRTCLPVASFG